MNSLPLPGAVGRGPGATIYHVEVANVGTLESNSPVMVDDVVVGSIGNMRVNKNWHADVEIAVEPGVVIPANAIARVGQTSLLGSMHLELSPPPGQAAPDGCNRAARLTWTRRRPIRLPSEPCPRCRPWSTVGPGADRRSRPQFQCRFLRARQQLRDLLERLDKFVTTLDQQRDNIVASIQGLNRLAEHSPVSARSSPMRCARYRPRSTCWSGSGRGSFPR